MSRCVMVAGAGAGLVVNSYSYISDEERILFIIVIT